MRPGISPETYDAMRALVAVARDGKDVQPALDALERCIEADVIRGENIIREHYTRPA
jgi:hypothetical protein